MRNLYGFELDPERIDHLVENQAIVWKQFVAEIRLFMNWMQRLSQQLDVEN